jgi:hypothetical protein
VIRSIDLRTSSPRSVKDSATQPGACPVSCCRLPAKSSSVKVNIPQSVWWIRMISRVPSSRCEMASERISSSVTTPPALRMTCASPSFRPRMP